MLDVLHIQQVCQLKCFVGCIDVDLRQFCQSRVAGGRRK